MARTRRDKYHNFFERKWSDNKPKKSKFSKSERREAKKILVKDEDLDDLDNLEDVSLEQ